MRFRFLDMFLVSIQSKQKSKSDKSSKGSGSKSSKSTKSTKSTSSSGGGRGKRSRRKSSNKSSRKEPGSKTRKEMDDRAQELMEEENAVFLAAFADNRGGMSMPSAPTPRPRPPPAPTRPPVPTPTIPTRCGISSQERRAAILGKVSKISDPVDLLTENSPQRDALDFIVDEDLLQLCPDDPTLGQRYILSVFYYSTDGQNWSRCSKPNDTSNADQVAAANARCNIRGDGSQLAGTDAWLTPVSECEWGGITCADQNSVTSLFTGEFHYEVYT